LDYDWYGAYEETPEHLDHPYKDKLTLDYTFGYPRNYENVNMD